MVIGESLDEAIVSRLSPEPGIPLDSGNVLSLPLCARPLLGPGRFPGWAAGLGLRRWVPNSEPSGRFPASDADSASGKLYLSTLRLCSEFAPGASSTA